MRKLKFVRILPEMTIISIALIIGSLSVTVIAGGCAAKQQVRAQAPTPLPAGAVNQFDATMYRVIYDAQAAIESVRGDAATGKIHLNQLEEAKFNQIVADYNAAQSSYATYHKAVAAAGVDGGAVETVAVTAAVTKLVGELNQLPGATTKGTVK